MIRRFLRRMIRDEDAEAFARDTAAWLAASGWADVGTGDRQVYASWLLEMRDRYERARVS